MSDQTVKTNRVHELFAYLCVTSANDAIRFYAEAFGAQERFRLAEPSGRVGHAEIDFGGGIVVMLSEEYPECGIAAPKPAQGTSVTIHLHVDNADEIIEQAVRAGATLERPPTDAFYGERSGVIRDPFGHRWNIGHSIEQVSTDEMQKRYTELLGSS